MTVIEQQQEKELKAQAKKIKSDYMKAYRKAHKEEFKVYAETYWTKKAKAMVN